MVGYHCCYSYLTLGLITLCKTMYKTSGVALHGPNNGKVVGVPQKSIYDTIPQLLDNICPGYLAPKDEM